MDNFNDIRDDLNENIDLKSDYRTKDINVGNKSDITSNDILSDLGDINIKNKNNIKINKKNSNFDSFYSGKDNKINIRDPKKDFFYFINKIRLFFKKYYLLNKLKKKKKKLLKKKHKKLLLFVFFVFVLFFANKILVENLISYGYGKIISLTKSNNIDEISLGSSKAHISLKLADIFFTPFSFIPNNNISNVSYVIKGGERLSSSLSDATDLYFKIEELKNNNNLSDISITDSLIDIKLNFLNINKKIYSALFYYSYVGNLGNDELNNKLDFGKKELLNIYKISSVIEKNYDVLLSLFGHNTTRKYLVVFQNNDEIRPTGGFMGSTATITIKNGKIIDIDNSDIYAHEWNINKVYTQKIKAPEGLNQITGTFGLRDANYFPEFKQSANTIKSFLDMIDYNIDGIIFINQNIVLDLLDEVGSINSEILGMNINDKNFSLVISTLVEAKVFKIGTLGTPKQVLFDFAGELYGKLIEKGSYYNYFKILSKHIKNRDIVFYSFRSEENSLLWKLGINGDINFSNSFDFNYPVFTSIGGNKTDRYIDYNIKKVVQKIPDSCDYTTSLKISKTHNFSNFEDEKVNKLLDDYGVEYKIDILNIQGRGDNKSYLRILLPKNIEVNLQEGQTLTKGEKYNIISLYTYVRKMETGSNTINYRILNPDCIDYSYKYYKQPGINDFNIELDILKKYNKYNNISSDFIYKD